MKWKKLKENYAVDKKTKLEALEELKTAISKGDYRGLCEANLINFAGEEYCYLDRLIRNKKPIWSSFRAYYWKPYKIKPRIKWIDKRIRELQNE